MLSNKQSNTTSLNRLSSKSIMIKKNKPIVKSRAEKRRCATVRAGASDVYQTFIPNFFVVLDRISALTRDNDHLRERLKEMTDRYRKQHEEFSFKSSFNTAKEDDPVDHTLLLRRMMDQAVKQGKKKGKGRRYQDRVLLDFSLNIWILGGRRTYEILYDNMPGIFPSPSLVHGKLAKFNESCEPGKTFS